VSSSNLPLTQDQPSTTDSATPSDGPAVDQAQTSDSRPAGLITAESGEPVDGAELASTSVSAEPEPDPVPTEPDEIAAAAVEFARQAAEETAEPNTVGAHLGVTVDDGGLTMHSFTCTARGYRGWRWAVTLARVPGYEVTVCDVVLLPGADSILAPAWVPWSDRLAPGDLGVGDDLPYRADDPLLVPGYTVTDPDDADQELFWELGLGRERVVGLEGLQAAAERWQNGPHGPTAEIAIQASAACVTCAYFLPVSGFLRQHFGACTNEWSPADGTVVTTDFGCGAHSETDLELPAPEPLPAHILDETVMEHVVIDRSADGSAEPSDLSDPSASETDAHSESDSDEAEAVADAEVVAVAVVGAEALADGDAVEDVVDGTAEETLADAELDPAVEVPGAGIDPAVEHEFEAAAELWIEPEVDFEPKPERVDEDAFGAAIQQALESAVEVLDYAPEPVEQAEPVEVEPVEAGLVEAEPVVQDVESPVVDAEPVVVEAEPVVEDVEPVIVDAEPVVVEAEPAVEGVEPPVVDAEPAVAEAEPVAADAAPVVAEAEPAVVDEEPLIEDVVPVVAAAEPAVVDVEPALVDDGPAIVDVEPVAADVQPAVLDAEPVADAQPVVADAEPQLFNVQKLPETDAEVIPEAAPNQEPATDEAPPQP
jgi:hypothetical protein